MLGSAIVVQWLFVYMWRGIRLGFWLLLAGSVTVVAWLPLFWLGRSRIEPLEDDIDFDDAGEDVDYPDDEAA